MQLLLTLLLFQEVPGLPRGSGSRGQACWALPQAGNEHARSQARCMPPQVTSSQAPASLHQGMCPQGRAHRRAFTKEKEWCSTWDIFSELENKRQVGCWLPATPGSASHQLGHGWEAKILEGNFISDQMCCLRQALKVSVASIPWVMIGEAILFPIKKRCCGSSQCPSVKSGQFPGLSWLSPYLLQNLVMGRKGLCHYVLITKHTNPVPTKW